MEKLEREVKIALGDLVDAQCQRVIGEDYREKAERGEEVEVVLSLSLYNYNIIL